MVKVTKATKNNTTKPQVSSLGRYKSSTGVVSTPKPPKSGYIRVKINGKQHLIHVLMALAFGLEKHVHEFRYGEANEPAVLPGEVWMDVV